jgi:hypothetical protein
VSHAPRLHPDRDPFVPLEPPALDARPIEPPLHDLEARERIVIDMMVSLARCLRDERARLVTRLAEVERDLDTLAVRLRSRGRRRPPQRLPAAGTAPMRITSPERAAEASGSESSSASLTAP